jgi:sterol 3beta-glucosyltransferase
VRPQLHCALDLADGEFSELIFEAVVRAGVRALISVGWGGLGGVEVPSSIFILEKPVPHDWLFQNVFAVCHHGGAGTTAIGLKMGRPTIVVPFFGDQPWWGHQVSLRGAGPEPIPHKQLTVEKLVRAIEFTQRPASLEAAKRMGEDIRREVRSPWILDSCLDDGSSRMASLPVWIHFIATCRC